MVEINEDIRNKLAEAFEPTSVEPDEEERINYIVRVHDGLVKQTDEYIKQEPQVDISTESIEFLKGMLKGVDNSLSKPDKLKNALLVSMIRLLHLTISNSAYRDFEANNYKPKENSYNGANFLVDYEIQNTLSINNAEFSYHDVIANVKNLIQYSNDYFDLQGIQDRFSKLFHAAKKVVDMKTSHTEDKFTSLFFSIVKGYSAKDVNDIFEKNMIKIAQGMTGAETFGIVKENPLLDLGYLMNSKTHPLISSESTEFGEECYYYITLPELLGDKPEAISSKPDNRFYLLNTEFAEHAVNRWCYNRQYGIEKSIRSQWLSYPTEIQIDEFKQLSLVLAERVKVFKAYHKFLVEVRDKLVDCFGVVLSDKSYTDSLSLVEIRLIVEAYYRIIYSTVNTATVIFHDFIIYLNKVKSQVDYLASSVKNKPD